MTFWPINLKSFMGTYNSGLSDCRRGPWQLQWKNSWVCLVNKLERAHWNELDRDCCFLFKNRQGYWQPCLALNWTNRVYIFWPLPFLYDSTDHAWTNIDCKHWVRSTTFFNPERCAFWLRQKFYVSQFFEASICFLCIRKGRELASTFPTNSSTWKHCCGDLFQRHNKHEMSTCSGMLSYIYVNTNTRSTS